MAHGIFVSAQVLLVLTLGLWTLDLGLTILGLGLGLDNITSHECIKVTRHPLKLWLVDCDKSDTEQKWYFTSYNEDGIPPAPGTSDNAHEEL